MKTNSKQMKGITIPTTVLESVANGDMNKEEAGEIFTMIAKYTIFNEEPEMNTLNYGMKILWITLKNELVFNIEKYLKKKEIAIENGKLGGRPKKEEVKIINIKPLEKQEEVIIQQEEENATEGLKTAYTEENKEEQTSFQRIIEKTRMEDLNDRELCFLDAYKQKKKSGKPVRFDEFEDYSTEDVKELYQTVRKIISA